MFFKGVIMKKRFPLSFSLALFAFSASCFAHPMVPVNAKTNLVVQNNTSGQLSIDEGQVHLNNIKSDFLLPKLPDQIDRSYRGVAVQATQGNDYSFTIPVDFPNNSVICTIRVNYSADTDSVFAQALSSKIGNGPQCSASVVRQGSDNVVVVDFETTK